MAVEHLTRNVRWHFEKTAKDYDSRRFETFRDLALEAVHGWLDRYSIRGRVLEIGVGTGDLFLSLHDRFEAVVGFDVSFEMVRLAREHLEDGKHAVSSLLLVGDGQRIPLAPGLFDAVISLDVLEHMPDPEAAVLDVLRVLKPAGLAFLTTPNPRWALPMWVAEKLNLKVEEGPHRYLFVNRLQVNPQMGSVEHIGYLVDWPFRIFSRLGKAILRLPLFRSFGFNQLIVIKKQAAVESLLAAGL